MVSQPERIGPLLTDSLRQTKETLEQFLAELPKFLLKWRFLRRITYFPQLQATAMVASTLLPVCHLGLSSNILL